MIITTIGWRLVSETDVRLVVRDTGIGIAPRAHDPTGRSGTKASVAWLGPIGKGPTESVAGP